MATPTARYRITAQDRSRQATRSAAGNFQRLQKVALRSAAVIGGAFASGAAIFGITQMQAEIGLLSRQLATNSRLLSQMAFIGDRVNISFQAMAGSLQRLQRRSVEAANGTGVALDALERLGLPAQKFLALSLEEKILTLADAFKRVRNPTERLELAVKFFDIEGARMVRILELGSAGISELQKRSDDLGATFGDKATKEAEKFNDELSELKASAKAGGIAIANQLLPHINTFIDRSKVARGRLADLGESIVSRFQAAGTQIATETSRFFGFNNALTRTMQTTDKLAGSVADLAEQTQAQGEATKTSSRFADIFDSSLKRQAGSAKSTEDQLKSLREQQQKLSLIRKIIGDNRTESRNVGTFANESLSRFSLSSVGGNQPQKVENPTFEKILQTIERIEEQINTAQLNLGAA